MLLRKERCLLFEAFAICKSQYLYNNTSPANKVQVVCSFFFKPANTCFYKERYCNFTTGSRSYWPFDLILTLNLNIFPYFYLAENVTLLFVGDISFSGPVKYYVEHDYHTYNDLFNEVAPYVREADISVGNLESPFVSKDVYPHIYKGKKSVILDASPKAATSLR